MQHPLEMALQAARRFDDQARPYFTVGRPAPVVAQAPFQRQADQAQHSPFHIGYDDRQSYVSPVYMNSPLQRHSPMAPPSDNCSSFRPPVQASVRSHSPIFHCYAPDSPMSNTSSEGVMYMSPQSNSSTFNRSSPLTRMDGSPSPLSIVSPRQSPVILALPPLQRAAPAYKLPTASNASLRRCVLMRQQFESNQVALVSPQYASSPLSCSSAGSTSTADPSVSVTQTTVTVPSKTPLPPDGDTSRIDPRHQHHYKHLRFVGLHGDAVPFNRIRVWTGENRNQLYDCVCGKRVPNQCLQKVKRHAYRHAVSAYTCGICGKVFKAHWSLNAHKRIHKGDD
uniref:C2H2-type domain-containing protein n=1 Tax=Spongospora subterranea TaxID=70186 RepID=A0A0H5RBV9_9EUKA|eukprot:CRZ11256.1 hypothetical protein [Spongospora subterranea]